MKMAKGKTMRADDLLEQWLKTFTSGYERDGDKWMWIDFSSMDSLFSKSFQEWLDENGYEIILVSKEKKS